MDSMLLLKISIAVTVAGFLFNKSRGMFYVILFWEWVLLGFCSDTTRFDYANYVYSYDHMKSLSFTDYSGTEPGYFLVCKFFQLFGLSFHDAYKIIVLFIIFSVAYVVRKNTKRICIPMVLFLWYPAIMSVYNTREGIAMGIVLIAIQVLLDDRKNCLLKYIILILISGSIHTSAFFYLIFIVLKLWNQISKKKIVAIVFLVTIVMFGIDNFTIIQMLMGTKRFSYYFGFRHVDVMTAFISIAWQSSICAMIFFLKHLRIKVKSQNNMQVLAEQEREMQFDYIEKIFLLMLVLCPMYFYTFTYIRLVRNVLILFYIYYANWLDLTFTGNKWLKNTVFIIWCLATFYGFNVVVGSDFEQVIQVFYRFNDFSQVIYQYIFGIIFFVALILGGFIMDLFVHKNR